MSRHALRLEVRDDCPHCGDELVLKRRKADGGQFIGCRRWPSCDFACDAGDQDLREEVLELRRRIAEAERRLPIDVHVLNKGLRDLIAWSHPDRHPDGNLDATETTARLNALRREVRG